MGEAVLNRPIAAPAQSFGERLAQSRGLMAALFTCQHPEPCLLPR